MFRKRILCCLLAVVVFSNMCMATAEAPRSSLYLNSYSADVTPVSGGKLAVTVDVFGRGYQQKIGATAIYLYESTDDENFSLVETYEYEDYPDMMGSGTVYSRTPVTYTGVVGRYYYASVYCYAGNGTVGDERNYTTTSVRAIR